MELAAVVELDGEDAFVYARAAVYGDVHLCLNAARELVAPSFHEVGRNWRMMAYLLEVNWASVDPSLVGFAQNRVEGLFHGQVNERAAEAGSQDGLELIKRVLSVGHRLKKPRKIPKRHGDPFNIAFPAEDINRERDIENALACQDILADSLDDEGQHLLLLPHLVLIDVLQAASLRDRPLALPQVMPADLLAHYLLSLGPRVDSVPGLQVIKRNYDGFIRSELRRNVFQCQIL